MMCFLYLLTLTEPSLSFDSVQTGFFIPAESSFAALQTWLPFSPQNFALGFSDVFHKAFDLIYKAEMAGWWLFSLAIISYITGRVQWFDLKRQLQRYTLHDPLTELPNRAHFEQAVEQQIRQCRKNKKKFALIVADVDRFKQINDTLSHHAGDTLLQNIGIQLKAIMRDTDMLARLGGDEFAFLFTNLEHDSIAEQLIQRIKKAMEASIQIDGLTFNPSLSMGVVLYPDHGDDADTLLRRADVSLYKAKERRNCHVFYDENADEHTRKTIELQNDLKDAIRDGTLEVYYQPKVDCLKKEVRGFEALARWIHPVHGFISPGDFIPMAKKNGLISDLTQVILRKSIQQVSELYHQGMDISLSVNITEENLEDTEFPQKLAKILDEFQLPAPCLELEITEDVFVDKLKNAVVVTEALKQMGVEISIDDFGTGYTSISHLKKLPISTLKIDMSFVQGIQQNPDDEAIVRTTILLSKSLGLDVVAEGVEDEQTLNTLAQWKCDMIQGFYVCKPLPFPEIVKWLKNTTWRPILLANKTQNGKIVPFKKEQTG